MHSILNLTHKIGAFEDGSECTCYILKYLNNVSIICLDIKENTIRVSN